VVGKGTKKQRTKQENMFLSNQNWRFYANKKEAVVAVKK